MAVHREEGRFVVRIELSAEQLRAEPGFRAIPASRGRSPEDETEIAVVFEPRAGIAVPRRA
jgi:hypothetical protein